MTRRDFVRADGSVPPINREPSPFWRSAQSEHVAADDGAAIAGREYGDPQQAARPGRGRGGPDEGHIGLHPVHGQPSGASTRASREVGEGQEARLGAPAPAGLTCDTVAPAFGFWVLCVAALVISWPVLPDLVRYGAALVAGHYLGRITALWRIQRREKREAPRHG